MTISSNEWDVAKLGDLASIEIGRTPSRANPRYWNGTQSWLTISDFIQGQRISATKERVTEEAVRACGIRIHDSGTLVMSFKLTIGKLGFLAAPMATNEAIAALKPLTPLRIDPKFLYHALSAFNFDEHVDRAAKGRTLNKAKLVSLPISFPKSIVKQREIAAILDKADGIYSKRRQAQDLTDDLVRSTFLEMFGDPAKNPNGWPVAKFGELLTEPLRNGISPSSKGRVAAQVLTLAAITGASFDPRSVKEGMFLQKISEKDQVSRRDFYICRGNGNGDLVGKGVFATASLKGVAFPDTMIAARADADRISEAYLEAIWKSPFVRSQIFASARTTNGTYKINQTATENVLLTLPPISIQRRYQSICDSIKKMKKLEAAALENEATLLLTSLQRALRGEL